MDVETAFLYGELEEEVYMICKENHEEDEVLLLQHSIYGLVQSARQYFKYFINKLRKIGFKGGYPDPCLMTCRDKNGIVFTSIWVDDSLLVGNTEAVDATIEDLRKEGFVLKVEGALDDYLSCEITILDDNSFGWIHQPHLITKIEKKFGIFIKKIQPYKTPGTPGLSILRNPELSVDDEKKTLYQSGVGMLLYLVKHTQPDIANPVRELSKCLNGPNKELLSVVKFVIDTKDLALKLQPIAEDGPEWQIVAFSDSDYAGDKETRISVAGFILYLMGVPISWRSKGEKSVTLSSSEAEYVALSEAAKEVKYVYQVLARMGIQVKFTDYRLC